MAKRWFKIKHGIGVDPMVLSMGSGLFGGDVNPAIGCWVRWLDYVETHSPKTGRVLVSTKAGFGEMVVGNGSKRSVCEKVAGWLIEYRDEEHRPILTYEDGVVQMLRWEERLRGEDTNAERQRRYRERQKEDRNKSNVTPSLSLSSSSSSQSEEEPEFVGDQRYPLPESLWTLIREDRRAKAASEIGQAWAAWCSARVQEWGEFPSASIQCLRREIAEQLSQRGPEFVAWSINRAAAGAYKTIAWDAKAWKAAQNDRPRQPGQRRRGGTVR